MELPLELNTRTGCLHLEGTADNSRTRLLLTAGGPISGARLELDTADVQLLAAALLTWLNENEHELPDPVEWWRQPYVQEDEDEDEEGHDGGRIGCNHAGGLCSENSPPPGHGQFGQLLVRSEGSDLFIDRADDWITCSPELWQALQSPAHSYATVGPANVLTLTDSAGAMARYWIRPDVTPAEPGALALERVFYRPATVPEHTR
jgi:hypothetical protein